jgi:hypothetical protein
MTVKLEINVLEISNQRTLTLYDLELYFIDFLGQHNAEHEANGKSISMGLVKIEEIEK